MDRLDPITRQVALEQEYTDTGYAMALARIRTAEEKGQADRNPYTKGIMRDVLPPLAAAIRLDLGNPRPGWHKRATAPLEGLDVDAIAFLCARTALNLLTPTPISRVALALGNAVYRELVLVHIADTLPELYHVVSEDLDRRMSRDERHRYGTLRLQAIRSGISIPEWPPSSRADVGAFLLGHLSAGGIVELDKASGSCFIAHALIERMDAVTQAYAVNMPHVGPCVARPVPRTRTGDGGFHTARLQGKFKLSRGAQEFGDVVVSCANALQGTGFRVHRGLLDVVLALAKEGHVGEVLADPEAGLQRPVRPLDIPEGVKAKELTEPQQRALKAYKAEMRAYYEKLKLNTAARARCVSAMRMAQRMRDEPEMFFVYFADTRGRMYPATSGGVTPQGSDLQKALIEFSEGLPLPDAEAVQWFLINGANRWGFDKAPLADRVAWVQERHDQIMLMGTAPLDNREWLQADKPFQFLAWAMEYAAWKQHPMTFLSRQAVGLDGSCNGLQNLSALLRDEIGGAATNLTPNTEMADIYKLVAQAATVRMESRVYDDELKEDIRKRWLAVGLNRKHTKRSVMTTPYGVTRKAAEDYVIADVLQPGVVTVFQPKEYKTAARVLMDSVWPAIGDVVVKGSQVMSWLKTCSRKIIKETGESTIRWNTPSGFPARQTYWESDDYRIGTKLYGNYFITVSKSKDTPNVSGHAGGMAPNFVHSLDAAHMHRVADACYKKGIRSFWFVHDDFGTHAANTGTLYRTIREEFYTMYYQHDPIQAFIDKYPFLPTPPDKGTLDISGVLHSEFFFA